MRDRVLRLTGHFLRLKNVIGIKILQPLAMCEFQQAIAGCSPSAVWTCLPTNSLIKLADDVKTAVCRSIINYDNFLVRPSLSQSALDCIANRALCIVARN